MTTVVSMSAQHKELDLLGIGFGPSNLALAIALAEHAKAGGAAPSYGFIEKKEAFRWHGNMMLDGSTMQISFLKDLVTLRNPSSHFTFINYLHEKQRLGAFINLKTFFPTRYEYNDYLCWVASQFADHCHYGEEVLSVAPHRQGSRVTALNVVSCLANGELRERRAGNLVLGLGGRLWRPTGFECLGDTRIFHNAHYLQNADLLFANTSQPQRVAVIGGGQSAAEVYYDLTQRYLQVEATLITRSQALKPADDSPFVNEIFNPEFIDFIYDQPGSRRRQLLDDYRNTNYSVVDVDLIERIYHLFYLQKVSGQHRHQMLTRQLIEQVTSRPDGVALTLRDRVDGVVETRRYDAIILATGYRRDSHEHLLAGLADELDGYAVGRDYRLQTPSGFLPKIYLQGCNEDSHGLSDTLLSVLPVRAQEILDSLLELPKPSDTVLDMAIYQELTA